MPEEEFEAFSFLKDLDFKQLVFYQILKCQQAALLDVDKFLISVNMLESMMLEEVKNDGYLEEREKVIEEVLKRIPVENETERKYNVALETFRLLMKYFNKKIPKEVEGILE